MTSLPVDGTLPELIDALRQAPAVVLRAPTGTGKTTRVPPALLDSGLLGDGQLLMLQPRRVAARACARTMAMQRGESVGETIGYQVRFEKAAGKKTRILVVTEGILTRRFAVDGLLEGISVVVLDEFHERSVHTDLALAFLRELLSLRDDLKVVVMSATIDTGPVSRYLYDCPVITVQARTHPLRIDYLPQNARERLPNQIAAGVKHLLRDGADDRGHILAFLPGAGEIRAAQRHMTGLDGLEVVPLHGGLTSAEQDAALTPSARRRLILATNIAETSLTIEGVSAVVDSGYHKTLLHDHRRGVDRLDLRRVSRASADQRAGRAGRTGPGRVVRLWDQDRHQGLVANEIPELHRADLAGPLLQILDFYGPDLADFPFFEPPPDQALTRGLALLRMLDAVDKDHRLTDHGRALHALPLHPRQGTILALGAREGMLDDAASICALLSESGRGDGDLAQQKQSLEAYIAGAGAVDALGDARTMRRLVDTRKQLLQIGKRLKGNAGQKRRFDGDALARLLLAGYPDRLCVVREPGKAVLMGGRGVSFDVAPGEAVPKLMLALELVEVSTSRDAAKVGRRLPVTEEQVRDVLRLDTREGAVWDPEREAVRGVRQTLCGDLILREKPAEVDPAVLAETLAQQAGDRFDVLFRPDKDAAALLARLRFAAKHLPEEDWPDVSDAGLIAHLPQWLHGKRKLDAVRKLDWRQALEGLLDWSRKSLLDREVPVSYTVPSGSRIRIDYASALEDTGYPVLAVRLQEMFGQSDTPRVARDRVPVLLHLLAPNMRPAQVTRDLRNFWNQTYAEVRKELRRRYPKHSWPEDPWTAQAMRGAKRRRPNPQG